MGDGRHHARRIVRRLWPRLSGVLLTACAAAVLELMSGTVLRVPNPAAILVHFLDEPGPGLTYAGDNLRRLAIWAVSLPAIVV